ncbi:MAG: serine hydrolase [Desulfofustis sp.]|jgi:beta-lactamase class A|nr:serine hydrolase [Desulfofustis sp.]
MFRILLPLVICLFFPWRLSLAASAYDVIYVWDDNLDNVLDYQNQLAELLGDEVARKLRVVRHEDGRFGVIYDHNGTALTAAQVMVQHSEILRNAEFSECLAVEDRGYDELFNVSYGLGPNLDALKKRYDTVYRILGAEVGSNLFIEQTDAGNYTLIYRRRGDRTSTHAVAKKHAKMLKRYKVSTTIIAENNNPVVFGEASMLDDQSADRQSAQTTPAPESVRQPPARQEQSAPAETKQEPASPPVVAGGKKPVIETVYKEPVAGEVLRLGDAVDQELSRSIEQLIGDIRRQGRLSGEERTGWMVYDLENDKNLVAINADQVFQAASMIKPFIALAFFHQAARGEVPYGPKTKQNMELMIQRSNNAATNWVMKAAGGPETVNRILKNEYGTIFRQTSIVEYIPPGGRTYLNSASPSDYVRFLQQLWRDNLPYSKEIRRLMSLPKRDRLYHGTPIPRGTLVYGKTGSTAHLCGDMGILVLRGTNGKSYPYALVGVIERATRAKDYGNWMLTRGNVIRKVSTLVYQTLKTRYPLR